MEKISQKRKRYEHVILDLLKSRMAYLKNIKECYMLVDEKIKHFMLLYNGWVNGKYKHVVMLHLHLGETGKISILLNDMDMPLIQELTEAGVDKQDIVVEFRELA